MQHFVTIGSTGQLARALAAQADIDGIKMSCFGRSDCDLAASDNLIEKFAAQLPPCEALILAAAYTQVDQAEAEPDIANQVNTVAPGIFAAECARRKIPLIHVSTDYVFAGNANWPYRPGDAVNPINAYGESKLKGEQNIAASGAVASILRTSWVFDGYGQNFFTTMMRLGKGRKNMRVVKDQIGRPTFAGHLAKACLAAAQQRISSKEKGCKVYHFSSSGTPISWAEFSKEIFRATHHLRDHTVKVEGISSSEYPTKAKRPAYSVLDISRFERDHDLKISNWKHGLSEAIAQWTQINI